MFTDACCSSFRTIFSWVVAPETKLTEEYGPAANTAYKVRVLGLVAGIGISTIGGGLLGSGMITSIVFKYSPILPIAGGVITLVGAAITSCSAPSCCMARDHAIRELGGEIREIRDANDIESEYIVLQKPNKNVQE